MQTTFDEYSTRYRHVTMTREAGVLELRYSFRESETEARPDLGFRIARSIN